MVAGITDLILEGIKNHGMLAVIIGVVIETVIVPLPSPLIVMAAGFILIPQGSAVSVILSALWIAIIAGSAQAIGSLFLYIPGYYIGEPFIKKYEKFHGVSWKDIENFQKKFGGRREDVTLFFLRAIPIMPLSVVSGVAGVMKVNPKRYFTATLLGVIPRDFALAILGFMFGGFYTLIAKRLDQAETILTISIVGLIGLYIIGQKFGYFDKIRKHILK